MYDQVIAARGEGRYVIRLAEGVYVFVGAGEENCQFSADPWSFLKFGYYTEPGDYSGIPHSIRHIDTDVSALTQENKWQYLCTFLSADDVKKAWEDFKQRYDIQFSEHGRE